MPVHILNLSTESHTLPYPLRGMMAPNKAIVLDYTRDALLALCPDIDKVFLVRDLPGASSFDAQFIGGGFSNGRTVTESFTFEAADLGSLILCDSALTITGTIPPHSEVAYPLWIVLSLKQKGAGQAAFVAGTGVDPLEKRFTAATAGQHAIISAVQTAVNRWTVFGDTAAA